MMRPLRFVSLVPDLRTFRVYVFTTSTGKTPYIPVKERAKTKIGLSLGSINANVTLLQTLDPISPKTPQIAQLPLLTSIPNKENELGLFLTSLTPN